MDGWASPSAADPAPATTRDIIQKESTIRDVVQLQQSLAQLLAQMDDLAAQNEQLEAEGDLLQMYIENLSDKDGDHEYRCAAVTRGALRSAHRSSFRRLDKTTVHAAPDKTDAYRSREPGSRSFGIA